MEITITIIKSKKFPVIFLRKLIYFIEKMKDMLG